jgi:hypothetical protein
MELSQQASHGRSIWRSLLLFVALLITAYGLLAYVVLPFAWTHYEHQRGLEGLPMVTRTAQDIPGDPLNVGLVGSEAELIRAMHVIGWYPADPITLRSSLGIAASVLFKRPYPEAPVSPLFFDGRRQDLAFEKPVGNSADQRHHVRFWKVLEHGDEGQPVWLGSVTFDSGVGLSGYTGQITHHIAPDIDEERNFLMGELASAGMLRATYQVTGIGPTLRGRNGGGDPYYTDGEIEVGRLVGLHAVHREPPVRLPSPPLVELKDDLFDQATDILLE